MSKVFDTEMKKSLANRIQNIKNKSDIKEIKKLILDNNPELDSTTNTNGLFLRFQKLSQETYPKIKKFLDIRDKQEKLKEIQSEIMDSEALSEEIKFLTETSESASAKNSIIKKYRLTNEETNLMNRIKYEKNIEENAKTDPDEIADIFVHTKINNASTSSTSQKKKSK